MIELDFLRVKVILYHGYVFLRYYVSLIITCITCEYHKRKVRLYEQQ